MSRPDFDTELKWCEKCKAYRRYLMSINHSYCAECGEKVRLFSKADAAAFGDFAENIATEGIDWKALPVGTHVRLGEEVEDQLAERLVEFNPVEIDHPENAVCLLPGLPGVIPAADQTALFGVPQTVFNGMIEIVM